MYWKTATYVRSDYLGTFDFNVSSLFGYNSNLL